MRGRRPTPTWYKNLTGNPGRRPINTAEPQPSGDLAEDDAPEWLTPEQRLLWRQVILDVPTGLLRRLDGPLVASYVCAMSLRSEAMTGIGRYGTIVKNSDGDPIKSPWLVVLRMADATILRSAAELGFSPSSRSRVTLVGGKKKSQFFEDLKAMVDDVPTKPPGWSTKSS